MNVMIGSWEALAVHARAIRLEVFVHEQGVPVELEWDGIDPDCTHAIAFNEHDCPVATGRLLPDAHIGRMAVLAPFRNRGFGGRVLHALITVAEQRGDREIVLSAQTQARGFYERFGFCARGDEYLDAGITHIDMTLALT